MICRSMVLVGLMGVSTFLFGQSAVANGKFQVIAATQMPLAGEANSVVLSFGRPVMSDSGKVLFTTLTLTNGNNLERNLVSWQNGHLVVLWRAGQAAPGVDGAVFSSFLNPSTNSRNEVSFSATLGGPAVSDGNNTGVWSIRNGTTQLLAREGETLGSHQVGDVSAVSPIVTENGTSFFLTRGASSLWRSSPERELSLVAKAGMLSSAGTPFVQTFIPETSNDSGTALFPAYLENGPGDPVTAIFSVSPTGNLSLFAKQGDPLPSFTPNGFIRFFSADPSLHINPSGVVSFSASIVDDRGRDWTAILSTDATGQLHPIFVFRSNSPPGESSTFFRGLGSVLANDVGLFAFSSFLEGPGANASRDTGIWTFDPLVGVAKVFQEGDPAPGISNALFGQRTGSINMFDFNDLGQVLFLNSLTGAGVSPADSQSLWLGRSGQPPKLLARANDVLEIFPGVFKTIHSLNFDYPESFDFHRRGLDNAGRVVFTAQFTDGTLAAIAVPEVSSVAMLGLLGTAVGVARLLGCWPSWKNRISAR